MFKSSPINPMQDEIWSHERNTSDINEEAARCNLFMSLGGTCLRDGNMYGAVVGDLATGCSAFEKTRLAAILQCVENLRFEEAKIPGAK